MFWCYIMNAMHNTVAGSYYCLELDIEAVAKEVTELLMDDHFMLSGLVSTLPFTIPD